MRAGSLTLGRAIELLARRGDTGNAVDGGAGNGSTALEMIGVLTEGRRVIAYEPFPGNHRFWEGLNPRLELRPTALGAEPGKMTLSVPAIVDHESPWGQRGLEGYSSAGHLVDDAPAGPNDVTVEVVVGDDDLADSHPVGVVKLDLQGGERSAIAGLTKLLADEVQLAWVELFPAATPVSVVGDLQRLGFVVFDTEYLLRGSPTLGALRTFVPTFVDGRLSSGTKFWKGVPRHPWTSFQSELEHVLATLPVIQTDLLCVRAELADDVVKAFDDAETALLVAASPIERATAERERDTVLQMKSDALAERDAAVAERDAAVAQRNAAVVERDVAVRRCSAILNSRSWRWTSSVRAVRRKLRVRA